MADSGTNERKIAWITGASRGMGADTTLRLAELGYDVALTARDAGRLEAVAAEARTKGARAFVQASDLTARASVSAFADAALAWTPRCDLVCNIGVYQSPGGQTLFRDMPIEELATSLEADVTAPAVLIQRALPSMIAAGGGFIVNMSSAVTFLEPSAPIGDGGWSLAYAAAKSGLDQFSKLINFELGEVGIRCFTVEPGYVAYGANFVALLRDRPEAPVSPGEVIGPAIAWLVSDPRSAALLAKRVHLPAITQKHGLLDGWDGPGSAYPTRW